MFLYCSICPLLGASGGSPYRYRNILSEGMIRPSIYCGAGLATPQGTSARRPVSRVLSQAVSPRDGHSSGTPVTGRLARPTRAAGPETDLEAISRPHRTAPTWSCSRRGLPCRTRCRVRGALLPHPFTIARRPCGPERAVCSLWHFPWGRPRRALPGSVLPWSPDFPPSRAWGGDGGHPAIWRALTTPVVGLGQAVLGFVRRQARIPRGASRPCRHRLSR